MRFYLPDNARYDYLLNLPGDQKAAQAIKEAMEAIESYQDTKFQGVLPKDAFFDIEKKKDDILPRLLKTFSDIPQDASGDVFGKIYEYFLGKFALSEGQKGGEFFTPTSVVRFIVEVIEPYRGKIYDPACGSGGMFVQSAKFVQEAHGDLTDIYVYGQEYMGETVRLAKMNLLVNNLRGEIIETNSYERDPHDGLGKFDYVMANPPFNVKSVQEATVKDDPRFTAYGLPTNKGKNTNITDANYLWISLFASSLNATGRAGFVMANSASDARNSEYDIRKRLVDSGIVDCMVTMPTNMFYTVTLPATIWFFDKGKVATDRKDTILFLDGRNYYRQLDRAHRDWSEEQVQNLAAIVRLYRGETDRYLALIGQYLEKAQTALDQLLDLRDHYRRFMQDTLGQLRRYADSSQEKQTPVQRRKSEAARLPERLEALKIVAHDQPLNENGLCVGDFSSPDNAQQLRFTDELSILLPQLDQRIAQMHEEKTQLTDLWKDADQMLKVKSDKTWTDAELNKAAKRLDKQQQKVQTTLDQAHYLHECMAWLQERFPDATYRDVMGLCKAAPHEEYADEQDYSLNAGRYVGVEVENIQLSPKEYSAKLRQMKDQFVELTEKSQSLEVTINENINSLL